MNKSQAQLVGIGAVFLIICLVIFLFVIFHAQTPSPQSTFVLSPIQAPSPTPYVEPLVLKWENYTNDTYQFSIDYPTDWKKQEYPASGDQGGMTVAFSPDALPCGNCSYVKEGFYSVRIYNHVSDPLLFDQYETILKDLPQSKTDKQVTIDSTPAILHGTSIFVEHNGWVYEISLDQMGNATSVESSKIFVHAATSFAFTTLKFIK